MNNEDELLKAGGARFLQWCEDYACYDEEEKVYFLAKLVVRDIISDGIMDDVERDSYINELVISYLMDVLRGDNGPS